MEKKDIAIVGAGGLGREVACLIRNINEAVGDLWNFVGFFDDGKPIGYATEYGNVLGTIDDLNQWSTPIDIVVAIGNPQTIKRVVSRINNPNVDFPNVIAPDITFVDDYFAAIGKGNVISFHTHISCNVALGDFNLLNGYVAIGHDAAMGSFNVVMPNVNISGGVEIGDENFLGVKSTILQNVKMGNCVRVGANSVIIRNTKDNNLYMGNPATIVKL